jgi:small subunit ribosomal protein S9
MPKKKVEETIQEEPKTIVKKGFISGTGRRKTAVARVFLYKEKGDFTVNDQKIEDYFPTEKEQLNWMRPFHIVGVSHPSSKFSASIKVFGSGKPAQIDAIVHGLSRALTKVDPEWAKILSKEGFMTRDSRMVERKKPNLHKARKATQYSKR